MSLAHSFEQLKQNLHGEIFTSESHLDSYSRDASIFQISPQAIVYPKNISDVQTLVRFCNDNKATLPDLSLTPRGGGTDMTGGSINDSLIIDTTKYLNKISELTDDSVWTEPGVMFRDLEIKLLARNKMLPSYPASKDLVSVGGMVGNNAGGEKTFKYGQTIQFVQELEVVLNDGKVYHIKPLNQQELEQKLAQKDFEGQFYKEIYKLVTDNARAIQLAKPTTSKNSSGYYLWDIWDGKTFDLTKLFVGSQGTLGFITKIKWKIIPATRHSKPVVVCVNDISELGILINQINSYDPESFEVFDQHTLKLAIKFLPEIIRKTKSPTWKMFRLFLPDILQLIKGKLPKIILLVEFAGATQTEADSKAQKIATTLQQNSNISAKILHNNDEAKKYWTIRRESYNLLRDHNSRKLSAPFIEDIVVHPEQLPEFMPNLEAILSKYPQFIYTIAGHAGDANFHIIPLIDVSDEHNRQQIIDLSDEVFRLVKSFGGSMSAEHNDGLVRGSFLSFMFGENIYSLFKQVKTIFDPNNIFNPHKKTDASLSFYTEHLKHH